jgi:DNA-binding transcriptional MerR regulator
MDLRLMGLLTCLKNTGMPIKRIRDYVELTSKGDDTLQERYEIIKAQRQFVLDQIEQLQYYLEELDFKDWYYNKALAAGSESAINLDDYEKETGKKAPDDPNRQD